MQSDALDAGFVLTPLITVSTSTPFAIEKRQVTVAQFAAFRSHDVQAANDFAQCPGKTALGPATGCTSAPMVDENPITCVDWCDAQLYCSAIGRRLCGAIGPRSAGFCGREQATHRRVVSRLLGPDERVRLSLRGLADERALQHGLRLRQPDAAGVFPACHGADPGLTQLFDMSGNVLEWVNSCEVDGAKTQCRARGGAWLFTAAEASCGAVNGYLTQNVDKELGIRCCADP